MIKAPPYWFDQNSLFICQGIDLKSEKKWAFFDVRSSSRSPESANFPVISLFIREFNRERGSIQTVPSASESLSGKSFARSLRNRPRIARILVSCGTRDGGIRSGTKRILGFCLCPESCWGHGKLGSFSFRQVVRRMVGVLILFPCPQDVRTPYSKPSAAGCLAHSTGILMPRLNASAVRLAGWRPSAMA